MGEEEYLEEEGYLEEGNLEEGGNLGEVFAMDCGQGGLAECPALGCFFTRQKCT